MYHYRDYKLLAWYICKNPYCESFNCNISNNILLTNLIAEIRQSSNNSINTSDGARNTSSQTIITPSVRLKLPTFGVHSPWVRSSASPAKGGIEYFNSYHIFWRLKQQGMKKGWPFWLSIDLKNNFEKMLGGEDVK